MTGPSPNFLRTTRLVAAIMPAAFTVAAGTRWRSTAKPRSSSSAAARSAWDWQSPGGLSDGTFTSSARNCTCAARAAVRRSRMMVSKSVIAIWSSLEKVGVEVLEEVEEHAGGRLGVLRREDRKRVVKGKSVSVRVDIGGGRIIKKKTEEMKKYM